MFNLKKKKKRSHKNFSGLELDPWRYFNAFKELAIPLLFRGVFSFCKMLIVGVLFKSACLPLNLVLDCADNNEPLTLYSSLYPLPTPRC